MPISPAGYNREPYWVPQGPVYYPPYIPNYGIQQWRMVNPQRRQHPFNPAPSSRRPMQQDLVVCVMRFARNLPAKELHSTLRFLYVVFTQRFFFGGGESGGVHRNFVPRHCFQECGIKRCRKNANSVNLNKNHSVDLLGISAGKRTLLASCADNSVKGHRQTERNWQSNLLS